ncbi:MAG: TauD/TfdA family dioxygenase [Actinomycetota bacterium]
MTVTVRPANNVLGAFISGVQVASCTDEELDVIKQAYVDHAVVFFRDQDLTPDQHIEFAQRWSVINVNRFFPAVGSHPTIAEVRKEPDQHSNIGGEFHTDHSYDQIPAMGSILYAREVPPAGGDTIFASQYAAYDALSDGMKATLATMRAVHSSRHAFGIPAASYGSDQNYRNADAATQDAIHPVIIEHPLSGRPALYVNGDFTTHFDGWRRNESAPLLQQLFAHAQRAEFTYRFTWQPGSMAIWDNRAVQHAAMNDYHGHRRLMHRITLEGEPIEAFAG